jgi:hypothetical protein
MELLFFYRLNRPISSVSPHCDERAGRCRRVKTVPQHHCGNIIINHFLAKLRILPVLYLENGNRNSVSEDIFWMLKNDFPATS